MYDFGLVIIFVIVGICVVGGIASTLWLGHDNPIEETAERITENKTGFDIDLTPDSKES